MRAILSFPWYATTKNIHSCSINTSVAGDDSLWLRNPNNVNIVLCIIDSDCCFPI